jgi:hypothetical protein
MVQQSQAGQQHRRLLETTENSLSNTTMVEEGLGDDYFGSDWVSGYCPSSLLKNLARTRVH